MWNKREDEPHTPGATPSTPPSYTPPSPAHAGEARSDAASIGPAISIVGDLSGDEDLTVLGKVDGKIDVPKHSVTVGRSGQVTADIRAKVVHVEGEVRGNLWAAEQIVIRKTATMLGNLTAPRVGLEDGCRFKGSVDMENAGADRTKAGIQPGKPGVEPIPPKTPPPGSGVARSEAVNPRP
jgi:cytoskeletal protein CcmA (bactofilin family)